MNTLIREMAELIQKKRSFALAMIVAGKGSSPRSAGAKMLVREDGTTLGTVGGGKMEADITQAARKVIENHQTVLQSIAFNGEDALDPRSLCGGQVEVLIEWLDGMEPEVVSLVDEMASACSAHQKAWLLTSFSAAAHKTDHALLYPNGDLHGKLSKNFTPSEMIATCGRYPHLLQAGDASCMVEPMGIDGTVYIFGAGHVGRSLAEFTHAVGFWTVILDDRPDLNTPAYFPTADELILLDSFEHAFSDLPIDADSYIVIVTRGHLFDSTVLSQALRTPAGYIGMIGSRRKCSLIFEALAKEGFSEADIQRVHAPIGISIHSETPAEIGVSIVAQLIQARADLR